MVSKIPLLIDLKRQVCAIESFEITKQDFKKLCKNSDLHYIRLEPWLVIHISNFPVSFNNIFTFSDSKIEFPILSLDICFTNKSDFMKINCLQRIIYPSKIGQFGL